MYFATVVCPTSMPSLSSSPWMRGAPQSGLAMLISRITWRISAEALGQPPRDSRFPAPIGPKAGAMPADHGIGLDDLQGVKNARRQRVKTSEHHPVEAREHNTFRCPAAEHIHLVPEHQDLGFQRCPRPEQVHERAPDHFADVAHRQRESTDSRRLTRGLGFR
jgi:hypothetical protein